MAEMRRFRSDAGLDMFERGRRSRGAVTRPPAGAGWLLLVVVVFPAPAITGV